MSPTFTPSQTNVCITSSGIIKKRHRKSHSPPSSTDLGQRSNRLRARRKSLPTQSTDLQTKPRTSQSFVPEGKDLVPRTTEQIDRPLKRTIGSEYPLAPKRARRESSQEFKASPNTSRPTGVHAIKPLTRTNLSLLQEIMSNSASTSPGGCAPHRRVSALSSSSKRSHSEISETSSGLNRAYAPSSINFQKCLKESGFDVSGLERPDQDDLDKLRKVMAQQRDSPEPDSRSFHLMRAQVQTKNETSVAKR